MLLYMTGGFKLSAGSMVALTSALRASIVAWGVEGPLVGLGDGLMGGPSSFSNSACMGIQRDVKTLPVLSFASPRLCDDETGA